MDYYLENCLPTFSTGNRPVEELAKTFDERVASLLQACQVVKLTGKTNAGQFVKANNNG